MRDPRCKLLEGGVGDAVERLGEASAVARIPASGHLVHASAFQGNGVDAAGDREEVPKHDRVPALLGGPPSRPLAPCPVAPERVPQREVVVGQVVLGQQVDLEGDARDGVEVAVGQLPRLVLVVAADLVRHVLVREPFGGGREVALEAADQRGLELLQELLGGRTLGVRHRLPILSFRERPVTEGSSDRGAATPPGSSSPRGTASRTWCTASTFGRRAPHACTAASWTSRRTGIRAARRLAVARLA